MCELHGYFTDKQYHCIERHIKNLTHFCHPNSTDYPNQKHLSCYTFISPETNLINTTVNCDYLVLSFYRQTCMPYLNIHYLSSVLDKFKKFKSKTLIELVFWCLDINTKNGNVCPITASQATLKSFMLQSEIFYDEINEISYLTYADANSDLHIVWMENTDSLLSKYSLIRQFGYRGIFIRDPVMAADGNWEAMYTIGQELKNAKQN